MDLVLRDSRKAVSTVLVFAYASSSTDLILFEQIQRHHDANTASHSWTRLEYNAFAPSSRGIKDKIHMIDRKPVYRLGLAIARRESQQAC